jgi:hypothetical protein
VGGGRESGGVAFSADLTIYLKGKSHKKVDELTVCGFNFASLNRISFGRTLLLAGFQFGIR